jgi:ribosomal protein S18 acetylase RimI-like enzyme
VLAAEQAAAEAELARKIAAEAERSYAMQAEAQQMQAEREQSAHAEAQKTAMLEFAESIGTNVQFEDDAAAENAEGLNQHKQSPPWKMTEMEPGANPLLQTDQLARELTDEVKSLRGRLEKASAGSLPRAQLRPKSAAAPTPSMLGPRLEMICDDLDALPVRPFSVVAFVGLLFILPVAPLVDTVSVGWHRLTQRKTPECPHGYQLRTFRVGDEEGWCACFHQWTAGPHESYTAAGWTPDRLDRWFNMAAGTNGGCGIRQPSRDLFLIERVHTEVDEEERDKASGSINENQSSSIVATACVWTTPSKTKKTLIERNGAKVVVAMPSTGEINWVASVDGHRGKGLGDVVTLAALQRLHELGYQSCWLETDDWRIPAIKTYFKYGFRKLLTHDSHTVRWETVEKMCRSGQIAPNVAPQLL